MVSTDWLDLNRDGRRTENVIKWCYAHIYSDSEMIADRLSYVDRFEKLTARKQSLVETVMGVKKIIKRLEKTQPKSYA